MRTRGRPRGTRNGKRLTTQWEPKKWKPLYEAIVVHHVAGHKSVDIAKSLKCTPAAVGLVLNSIAGKKRIEEVRVVHTQSLKAVAVDRLSKLRDKAFDRIEKVITDDKYAESAPLKIFDRAMKVLQATNAPGFENKTPAGGDPNSLPGNTITNNNVLITDPEIAGRVLSGFQKLEEIKRIHGNK